MACTKAGGIKVRETIYAKYGRDFYKKMGAIGGKTPTKTPKGFAANSELARLAAAKGGRISRRDKEKKTAWDVW